jgi:RNA-directed DNA polymerase
VKRRMHDRKILRLLKSWLKAGVMTDGGVEYPELGSPQGGVLSPLLSNIYLHDLDQACRDRGHRTPMVRYADDLVILCRTPAEARRSHHWLAGQVQAMGLGLNEAKTRVVHAHEGFDFLGFSYRPGRYLWQGQPRTTVIKVPRDRAKQGIRTRIKEAVKAIPLGASVHEVVKSVNARLKGWANYFRISNLYPALKRLVWHAETQIRLFLRRAYQCKRIRGTRRFPSQLIHHHLGLYTANALCGRS